MTRPPADEIERKAVEALRLAEVALFHSESKAYYLEALERHREAHQAVTAALSKYSLKKEYTMPSWDEFMMDRIRYRNEFGVFTMVGEHRYYESTHNAIRETLAREVK